MYYKIRFILKTVFTVHIYIFNFYLQLQTKIRTVINYEYINDNSLNIYKLEKNRTIINFRKMYLFY